VQGRQGMVAHVAGGRRLGRQAWVVIGLSFFNI
jgi:hypothetical protein